MGGKFNLAFGWDRDYLSQAMTKLKAHFDGKVLVPDEPVDLPVDCELEVHVQPAPRSGREGGSLQKLLELARQFPAGNSAPQDLAQQHDHYLYGLPKRS